MDQGTAAAPAPTSLGVWTARLWPGLLLAVAVAISADRLGAWEAGLSLAWRGRPVAIAPPVIALMIGIALHALAARPQFTPGLTFAIKKALRWAIALLGLNIAFSDIRGLGATTAAMVLLSMAATLAAGFAFARLLRLGDSFGALAGAACAVCGASAALATSSVLPDSPNRETNTAFVVITTNLIATFAVVAYPAFAASIAFDDRTTGIFLGASIHDVAQVVGAGYSVSKTAGNLALVVKLFRVFLLLPVVVGIGWLFARRGVSVGKAKTPVPVFALMFLGFVAINSSGSAPPLAREALLTFSRWGLLIALAALGLNTSLTSIARVGARPIVAVGLTSIVVFALPAAWLAALR